jgi:oligopeptide transport system substrate-binding protein
MMEPTLAAGVATLFPIVGARDFVEGRNPDFASVGIKALDSRTVRMNLRFRAPYFLSVLAGGQFVPVHRSSVEKFAGRLKRGAKWTQPGNMIGNGAFVLKEWKPNVVVTVTRNALYWNVAQVRLAEIRFYPIDDLNAEERAFRTGQLHVTSGLPLTKVAAYSNAPSSQLQLTKVLRTDFITFNTLRPPFSDARVRRAFSLAIDRERLASLAKGRGTPAYSFVPPGAGGYQLGNFVEYSPTEAKKLLRDAGFPDGVGFPPQEYMFSSGNADLLAVSEVLQQMWQQVLGVQIRLAPCEYKVLLARISSFRRPFDLPRIGARARSLSELGRTGLLQWLDD